MASRLRNAAEIKGLSRQARKRLRRTLASVGHSK
jgi:hypothetical protein